MKRALMYATVASMIRQFNMDNIYQLVAMGYEVDVVCNMELGNNISGDAIKTMKADLENIGVRVYHIPLPRKITAIPAMIRSYKMTRELMNEREYSLVHCHTPIGSVICRLAYRMSKCYRRAQMIYTAHGFHFYKGAPKMNWLMFYPVEKLCARFTDVLITINREDYELAQNKMKAGRIEYVPGVGIDLDKIRAVDGDRVRLCAECGIAEDSVLLVSVGELNDNKNHRAVISALPELPDRVHYLICGQGDGKAALESLAEELGCGERLHLLGFRTDVLSIMKSCDIFVFPSKREGLSVALMEAMACGLPCFVSDIRGNRDLIDQDGGALFPVDGFERAIISKFESIEDFAQYKELCGERNAAKVCGFSKTIVQGMMRSFYAE